MGASYTVIEIDKKAFLSCTALASVTIPNSITTIGASAFSNCDSLISIIIPASVETINTHAFDQCSYITIYCEASSKPSGWILTWNASDCKVVWGYNGEET